MKPMISPSEARNCQMESTRETSNSRDAEPTVTFSLPEATSPSTITSATVFTTWSSEEASITFGSMRRGST